jgi:hypothetical protein
MCLVCEYVHPSDRHFLESNVPYYFPVGKRIYGCARTDCNKRTTRFVGGKTDSQRSGESSSSAWSENNDHLLKEFIVIVHD